MFYRFLTPPPTSTNVERLFSYAGIIADNKRASLQPERLNKILFLRENLTMLNIKLDWWWGSRVLKKMFYCECFYKNALLWINWLLPMAFDTSFRINFLNICWIGGTSLLYRKDLNWTIIVCLHMVLYGHTLVLDSFIPIYCSI